MISTIQDVHDLIIGSSVFNQTKSDNHGEVFTPIDTIKKVLGCIDIKTLIDPTSTYLDQSAGKGNFPIIIVKLLNRTLASKITDERTRLKHIVEEQLFMGEYQETSANFIAHHFQFGMDLKVNLYVGDSLQMPDDFFDLSWLDRREKYPQHCVITPVEPAAVVEAPAVIITSDTNIVKVPKVSKKTKTVSIRDLASSPVVTTFDW